MMMYRALWATTWYSCNNLNALLSVLRELGVSSFLLASSYVKHVLSDSHLLPVDVIVWVEEVEL